MSPIDALILCRYDKFWIIKLKFYIVTFCPVPESKWKNRLRIKNQAIHMKYQSMLVTHRLSADCPSKWQHSSSCHSCKANSLL